jgi:hypothetical protein
MPATYTNAFNNAGLQPIYEPDRAVQHHVKLGNSLTLAKGTVLGQITASGLWIAYASGAADGSQIPRAVLAYDCVTDGSGNVTIGGGQQGETYPTAPAYYVGDFDVTELAGLNAAALTNQPGWRLLWGVVAGPGVLHMP